MKTAWFFGAFLTSALLAVAQPVVMAEWVDGRVERMDGSAWRTVEIGDEFGADSVLRLAKDASAELSAGTIRLHLTAPGIYKLSEAFGRAKGRTATTETVAKALRLAGKNDYDVSSSSAAGVRGEAAGPASVSWAEDEESSDPYAPVRALFEAGRYEEASKSARDLRLSPAASAAFRSAYWDASAMLARGLAVPARKILDQASPDPSAPEYRDAPLLSARIWMELEEWNKALINLEKFAPSDGPIENRQLALMLSATCYESMGKKSDVRKALEAARVLDPTSPLGLEAVARLGR